MFAQLRKLLISFTDLLLYGNFWIALSAFCMALQTHYILFGYIKLEALEFFVLGSTLFLYAIHRLVGLKKVAPFKDHGRYFIISKFKSHILIYAIISAISSGVLFFWLTLSVQLALIIPAILSLGYVIPLLQNQKRLRDLNYLKIYLIAIVWAWVTVLLPALSHHLYEFLPVWPMFLERMLFVFAITIPFDIRDLKIDAHTEVKTIPAVLGIPNSKRLAYFCLALVLGLVGFNYYLDAYSLTTTLAFVLSILSTGLAIHYADRITHDYFFTGLLDGTMIIQFLLIYWMG